MRRKVLMGALALALPAGLMAITSPSAVAKALPNPIACTGFGGLVTFGTPLTGAGVPTSAKAAIATTVAGGSFTCTGAIAGHNGALTIKGGKNVKLAKTDPRYNKAAGIKYVTGTKSAFLSIGGSLKKNLGSITFTIGGHTEVFQAKSATEKVGGSPGTGCPGEVGFDILGQVKAPPYNTKAASILACLGPDTGPGTVNSFGVDLFTSSTIITATIDPSESSATL